MKLEEDAKYLLQLFGGIAAFMAFFAIILMIEAASTPQPQLAKRPARKTQMAEVPKPISHENNRR